MQNTKDLRDEMVKVFQDLRDEKISTKTARSMVAVGNVILKSAAVEADYNKFLGLKKEIGFIKTQVNE